MSHRDAFLPRSVTKLHLPPCCSLCTLSIHSSSMPISASCGLLPSDLMTTHLSIIILLLRVEALLFPFCASYFPFIFCVNPSIFTLLSFFHPSIFPPFSTIPPPTQPPFLCQSAVTGFVGVGLAVSMSSHSQQ